jgi:predicted hydrocarbon binding protein
MEEAKIKIIMKENGDIEVYNNDTRTMIINYESDMQINAENIFTSLAYNFGKKYVLEKIEDKKDDKLTGRYNAMKKLHNFYKDLITKINEMKVDDSLSNDILLENES